MFLVLRRRGEGIGVLWRWGMSICVLVCQFGLSGSGDRGLWGGRSLVLVLFLVDRGGWLLEASFMVTAVL